MSEPGEPAEQEADAFADWFTRLLGPEWTPGAEPVFSAEAKAYFGSHLDHDFSSVRVHTDEHAARTAHDLGARAFTLGSDVYFGQGEFNLDSREGRRLLAHELTHAVQQSAGRTGGAAVQRDDDPGNDRPKRIKAYREALKKSDWGRAALMLNGFNSDDIDRFIDDLDREQLRAIRDAADEVMKGWPRVVQEHIEPLLKRAEEVAQMKRDYDEAVKKPDWDRAAIILNGFSEADIKIRLKSLTVEQLRKLDASAQTKMAGWPKNPVHTLAVQQMLSASPLDPAAAPGTATRVPSLGVSTAPSADELAKKSNPQKWQEWLDARDAKAMQFGAADYPDYVSNMLVGGGSVFGVKIAASHPVHPLFLDRLETASEKAKSVMGNTDFGVRVVSGQDDRPGNHAWGLAVDIDADANPYVLNEAGESKLDAVIAPIYQRIAQALLHRDSVMTPAQGGKPSGLEKATYEQLAEEADAMASYFSVLDTGEATAAKGAAKPARRVLSGRTFAAADLQKLDRDQVKKDYATLTGAKPPGTSGDTPFTGGGPGSFRDPARGFLSIRLEIAEALRGQGLRWGATDFPGASGDVMHFDDNNRHADYVEYGKTHQTAKRKGGG